MLRLIWRSKIVVGVVLPLAIIATLAIISLTYIFVTVIIEGWIERVREDTISLSETAINIISERHDDLLKKMKWIADEKEVQQALSKRDRTQLLKLITEFKLKEDIQLLEVMDSDMTILVRTDDARKFGYKLPLDHPMKLGIFEMRGSFIEKFEGKMALKVFAHVAPEAGKPIGAIAATIFLDDSFVSYLKRLVSAEVTIYGEDGIWASSFFTEDLSQEKIDIPRAPDSTVQDMFFGNQKHSHELGHAEFSHQGSLYVLGYFPLNLRYFHHPLAYVSIALPIEDIQVIRKEALFIFFTISGIALVLIILTGYLVTRSRITRPILALVRGARNITAGKLDVEIEKFYEDEIGELVENFNKMAENLKKSRATLEEAKTVLEIRVRARTRELNELAGSLENKVEERTRELKARLAELERFQKLTIGRELKMVELKKELSKKNGSQKKET